MSVPQSDLFDRIEKINEIGIALSAEKNTLRLLEIILEGAQTISNADAGTLYILRDNLLKMEIFRNNSLDLTMGGTTDREVIFPPIAIHDEHGIPNESMVVTYSVHHDETINIFDAYNAHGFDFSGTREFDKNTNYRSKSFLTIPMKDHENNIIGVLQLINAVDKRTNEIIAFSNADQHLAESLASQAAVALANKNLVDDLKNLFDSFVRLIATAIDEKSPYTSGHCQRLPELTMMLAEAIHHSNAEPFPDFKLTDDDRYELELAAWLHDCGKVTTPEYVLDKATKLETIHDRVHQIDTRFEVLMRDAKIDSLKKQIVALLQDDDEKIGHNDDTLRSTLKTLEEERAFIHSCNIGGEFMSKTDQDRVKQIAKRTWKNSNGKIEPILNEDEIYNLTIPKGTINQEERKVINNHIVVTIKMLESLAFPKHLKNVPEYAGGHHERIDGNGYPKGLTREQMSIQARIMAIADIFEALTDPGRPYKKGMKLSEALNILGRMKLDNHIDPDIFDVFIKDKVFMQYAEKHLDSDQIDEIILDEIPGYQLK